MANGRVAGRGRGRGRGREMERGTERGRDEEFTAADEERRATTVDDAHQAWAVLFFLISPVGRPSGLRLGVGLFKSLRGRPPSLSFVTDGDAWWPELGSRNPNQPHAHSRKRHSPPAGSWMLHPFPLSACLFLRQPVPPLDAGVPNHCGPDCQPSTLRTVPGLDVPWTAVHTTTRRLDLCSPPPLPPRRPPAPVSQSRVHPSPPPTLHLASSRRVEPVPLRQSSISEP